MKLKTDTVTVFTDFEREVPVNFEYYTEVHPEYEGMSRAQAMRHFDVDEDNITEITRVTVFSDVTGLNWNLVKETIMEFLGIEDEDDITID